MSKKKNSWYRKQIFAQDARLNELVDWVNDDTAEQANKVLNPNIVDFDTLERQRAENLPFEQGEMQTITEEEIGDFLVDDLVEEDDLAFDNKVEEGYSNGDYVPSEEELQERGIEPTVDDDSIVEEEPEDVPDFGEDYVSAVQWAINNNRVVKLSYLTLGKKRGRGGKQYLKREITDNRVPGTGINIWRVVEPHYIFPANNGYDILVTYDRSVRHIRAFRVKNITGVDFMKKKSTEEPSYFKPRVKIKNPEGFNQSGKIKGIEAMNTSIFQNLKDIGDVLEDKGLQKIASSITSTMSNLLNIKTAQYVGPQGYWIRQKRCWDNCYRHKRTTAPEKAAQTVWTECWEEYNKSINDNKSGWEKYASVKKANDDWDINDPKEKEKHCPDCGRELNDGYCTYRNCPGKDHNFPAASTKDKNVKLSQKQWISNEHKKFIKAVTEQVGKGKTQGMAIHLALNAKQNEYKDILIADAEKLSKIASKLKDEGQEELSERIANVSIELLKESQFSGGFEGAVNKLRKYNPFSSKSRAKGRENDIMTRLKNIALQARQLSTQFNTLQRDARQYGQEFAQESTDVDKWDQLQKQKQQDRQEMFNKAKKVPGQAFNWAKDKAQQAISNPAVQQMGQQIGQAFSNDSDEIKTAASSYRNTGIINFIKTLRSQLETFTSNLGQELGTLSQMAAQSTDLMSKQRASQASREIEQFINKSNQFISGTKTVQDAWNAAPDMVQSLGDFSNSMNMIQRGDVSQEAPVNPAVENQTSDQYPDQYPDQYGDQTEQYYGEDNSEMVQEPPASPSINLDAIRQQIDKGIPLDQNTFQSLISQTTKTRDEAAKLNEMASMYHKLYSEAVKLKSDATRAKNRAGQV